MLTIQSGTNMSPSGWRIAGASAVGTSHISEALPCQDSHDSVVLADGTLLMAVADGAGSVLHAADGSAFSTGSILSALNQELQGTKPLNEMDWSTLVRNSFSKTLEELCTYAADRQVALREFATTLLVVILTDEWTVVGLVGDCAAVGLNENQEFTSLVKPQRREYVNTTNFLTQNDMLESLDVIVQHDQLQCIAMLSDGLLELALNVSENRPYSPFFTPLFSFLSQTEDEAIADQQLYCFLNSDRVNARTADDKTLLLAMRLPATLSHLIVRGEKQ